MLVLKSRPTGTVVLSLFVVTQNKIIIRNTSDIASEQNPANKKAVPRARKSASYPERARAERARAERAIRQSDDPELKRASSTRRYTDHIP